MTLDAIPWTEVGGLVQQVEEEQTCTCVCACVCVRWCGVWLIKHDCLEGWIADGISATIWQQCSFE